MLQEEPAQDRKCEYTDNFDLPITKIIQPTILSADLMTLTSAMKADDENAVNQLSIQCTRTATMTKQ